MKSQAMEDLIRSFVGQSVSIHEEAMKSIQDRFQHMVTREEPNESERSSEQGGRPDGHSN